MNKDYEFKQGPLILLPYVPGNCAFTEQVLIDLYNRLHDEGLWPIVFHEDGGDITLLRFMNFFSDGKSLLQILALMDEDKIVDLVGMSWVADIVTVGGLMTRGIGSFVFFKEYQTPSYTDLFGEMILDYWFDALKIDVINGVTPEPNRAARLYVKRLGFKEYGRLPNYTTFDGKVVDGVLTTMTKDEWLAASEKE